MIVYLVNVDRGGGDSEAFAAMSSAEAAADAVAVALRYWPAAAVTVMELAVDQLPADVRQLATFANL